METDIIKSLQDLSYQIPDITLFNQAIEEGPKNINYTKYVNFLTNELRSLCSIDEEVNVISSPEDSVSFLMELSSFLKELGCPHENLVQGHLSDRLNKQDDKLLLLDYLISELMAARMMRDKKPDDTIELKLQESRQAFYLKKMLVTLRFPKPPDNIAAQNLFQKINATVQKIVQSAPADLVGNPACNIALTNRQWEMLDNMQKMLHEEYTIRREMLLKRLDCTIQSFHWSDRMKNKEGEINKVYSEKRKSLKVEPDVGVADLLCARDDIAVIEKTSNASVRKNTQSSVNKVKIGEVPDRGGRSWEQAAPPKEMPAWQQRQAGGGGGRGRGGGGRGRGDFAQRGGNRGGGGYKNQDNQGYNNQGYHNSGGQGYDNSAKHGYNSSNQGYENSGNQGYDNRGYNQSGSRNYERGYSAGNQSYDNSSYTQERRHSGGNYNKSNNSFDSAGSFSNNYGHSNYQGRDSAGSYDYEPKRPKTYDSFQNNKETYADQYVKEAQHNEQYKPRGRGRSSYNRGGGGRGQRY